MKILHIEDNPADARLFSKILSEAEAQAPSIIVKETLEEGLAVLKSTVFDAVFIDLNLSDSRGIGTLHAVLATHPGLPVIALTGMNDDELGSQAIKDGAQDYLPKDDLTPSGLRRSLRYGIERKKLMLKLEQQTQKARQEVEDLRKMIQPVKTHAVSSSIGFSDSQLRAFVLEYSQMLKQAVEEQVHKTINQHTKLLKRLIDRLGRLHAGPRDIIDLHLLAVDEISRGVNDIPKSAYFDEGRILLLECMGELVLFYQNNAHPSN